MKKLTLYCLFFFIGVSVYAQQGFNSFIAKNPERTFIGAIMKAKNINDDTHQFLNISLNPITISFSHPIKSQKISPSYNNMMKVVENLIKEGKIPMQNVGLSHIIKKIKSYDELNVLFGQKINPTLLFGVPAKKGPKRNIVAINLEQKFLSIYMDIPDRPILDVNKLEDDIDKLIYLNSVTFGRKAIVLVESEQLLSKIKAAINNVMQNYDSPEKITETTHSVLSNSNIRIMITGSNIEPGMQSDNALAEALRYFNRPITTKDFVTPIAFTAAWAKDNSVFENNLTL